MKIDLLDVSEQDMDMLIIEEFICNESFRHLFYDQEKKVEPQFCCMRSV